MRIAVTGGIACGKTLVGSFLAQAGVAVCETDALARRLMGKGMTVCHKVVAEFGKGILCADGEINREALGDLVFSDPARLAALNAIIHPDVIRSFQEWMARQGAGQAAVIVPLLYECGLEAGWDAVICVASREDDQIARLRQRGLSGEQAVFRVKAQMPVAEKMKRADYVICNFGTPDLLKEQTKRVLERILEK